MSDSKELFLFYFINRLKSYPLGDREGVNIDAMATKLNKNRSDVSYWDFLCQCYGLKDDVTIEGIIRCILLEKALLGGSSATEMKILNYLQDSMKEDSTTTLQKILKEPVVDINEFVAEL